MTKPLIQIGDLIREMTDEELAYHEKVTAEYVFPVPHPEPPAE